MVSRAVSNSVRRAFHGAKVRSTLCGWAQVRQKAPMDVDAIRDGGDSTRDGLGLVRRRCACVRSSRSPRTRAGGSSYCVTVRRTSVGRWESILTSRR